MQKNIFKWKVLCRGFVLIAFLKDSAGGGSTGHAKVALFTIFHFDLSLEFVEVVSVIAT